VAADYYMLLFKGSTEYFGSAQVDASGTLVSLAFSVVPEPVPWAMMLVGFGLAGAAIRRKPQGAGWSGQLGRRTPTP
jgi:hypothetical protein